MLTCLLLIPNSVLSADLGYQARLKLHVEGNVHIIEAFCQGETSGLISYHLATMKHSTSGQTTSVQKGTVELRKNFEQKLATIRLGGKESDNYTISLKIYRKGELVAQASTY